MGVRPKRLITIVTYYYPPFTIMVLLLGQFAAIWPKPKHLQYFLFEVLVGDLVLEGEGLSLEVCGVDSLEELEGLSCFENLFLSFQYEL